jgi:D-sedoheptulose 7-phosphate isomerase
MTAIGNDYSYEDVFLRQLQNYGRAGDVALALSVSGSSPNVVKAIEWARQNRLVTIGLVGAKRGRLAEAAEHAIAVESTHYGRVEDVQMHICHMMCYAFMEIPDLIRD